MKKLTNIIEYSSKGILTEMEDKVLTTETRKKDETITDSVDFNELISDVEEFCSINMDKKIEMSFTIKVIQE